MSAAASSVLTTNAQRLTNDVPRDAITRGIACDQDRTLAKLALLVSDGKTKLEFAQGVLMNSDTGICIHIPIIKI